MSKSLVVQFASDETLLRLGFVNDVSPPGLRVGVEIIKGGESSKHELTPGEGLLLAKILEARLS